MIDVAVSYNKYKFLGNEFLTWLWYIIENDINIKEMVNIDCNTIKISVGNSIVLENSLGETCQEKITIKGDDAGLEEGTTALRKGALVVEINLALKIDENEWKFTIKGESLNITGLKTPATGKIENNDEIEGAVLEKTYLCSMVFEVIDNVFYRFIKKRISEEWQSTEITAIQKWLGL